MSVTALMDTEDPGHLLAHHKHFSVSQNSIHRFGHGGSAYIILSREGCLPFSPLHVLSEYAQSSFCMLLNAEHFCAIEWSEHLRANLANLLYGWYLAYNKSLANI